MAKGRGVFSSRKNNMSVPKKGSALNLSSAVQEKDAMKVKDMAKMQMARENLRGMPS